MTRRFLIVFVFFLGSLFFSSSFFLFPSPAHAAISYYLSPSGSDSGSGSITSPWKTFAHAFQAIGANASGVTLYLRGGTYNDSMNDNVQRIPHGTDMTNGAFTVQSYPGEVVTIIGGAGLLNPVGPSSGARLDYFLIVKDLIFDGAPSGTQFGVGGAYNPAHIRLDNVEVKNCKYSGILSTGDYWEFINVHSHHNGSTSNLDHGLYHQSGIGTLVDGGEWDHNFAWGIQIYPKGSGVIVRNALVHDNGSGAIVTNTSSPQIYNNVIYGNGFQYSNSAIGTYNATNELIYNNTLYNNLSAGQISNTAIIRNNLVYKSGNFQFIGGTGVAGHNLIDIDPKFVNASAGDLHLQSGSPAIDAGVTLSSVSTDKDGVTRPVGSAYDIGAYEYGGIVTTPPPPNPSPPPSPSGSVYYISTAGSDANSGSSSGPWATISHAFAAIGANGAGVTVYLRGGTYTESIDSNLMTIPSGTSFTSAFTVQGYPGEIVILQPGSGEGAIVFRSGQHYTIWKDMILDASGAKYGIAINMGSHHNRFQNVEVKNSTLSGIDLFPGLLNDASSDYNEFINMHVHHVYGHGAYSETSNNLFDGGEYHDVMVPSSGGTNRFGIHIYSGNGVAPSGNTIRNIKSYNNQGGGVLIGTGSGSIAYNNVVYNNGNSNFAIGIAVSNGASNSKVYNNTVYGIGVGDGIGIYSNTSNTTVQNNIVYNSGGTNNYGSGGSVQSNNLITDPKFVNASAGDFHLQSTSPAINTGITISAFSTDKDGVTRPQGAAWDIGAYEFVGTVTAPPPLPPPSPSPAPTPPPAPSDWNFCAQENSQCSFSGTAQVRYGANGTYATLTLTNGTACTNAVFGDPIFGVVKFCYLDSSTSPTPPPSPAPTPPPAPSDWNFCAQENSQCSFSGTAQVRYGANGTYAYLTSSNTTPCTNSVFGDPIFGVVKSCYYSGGFGSATPPPTPPPSPSPSPLTGYTFCTSENGTCFFSGTAEVKYGANGVYASLILSNSTPCTNAIFGDPIFGVVKACYYQ